MTERVFERGPSARSSGRCAPRPEPSTDVTPPDGHHHADLRLTEWTSCGGCAAKWGASLLTELVRDMPAGIDPALLVGLAPFDDAAIYQVGADVALGQHDRLLPAARRSPGRLRRDRRGQRVQRRVRDGWPGGASRSTSPRSPSTSRADAIVAIFDAAAAVVAEAGGTIAGGHTIRNPEPIFGLAVQGVVASRSGVPQGRARVPATSLRAVQAARHRRSRSPAAPTTDKAAAIAGMRRLNRSASEQLQALGGAVHAVTDVTGYGLAGHGWEMAERGDVQVVVDTDGLVAYPGARRRPSAACARAATRATATYVAAHLQSTASRGRRGAVHGSADLRRAAGRGRSVGARRR